jgi:ABC-type nitrate/sulfonate/bicarbonate transport system substrate-binding protein
MVRKLAKTLAIATALSALLASGVGAADKVRVGKAVPFAFTFIPMEVGLEAGIWAKYGIEPEITGFGGDARMQQGLTSNSIDFGLGSGPGMGFMAKGVPAKGVAAFASDPRNLSVMVLYNSPIKSAADLKGKKLGVTTVGSLTDWLVKRMSMAQGWGPTGITSVPVGGLEPTLAALKTGQIDGAMMALEVAYNMEAKQEAKPLFDTGSYAKDFHTHIIFARQELIDKNPDVVQRFVNGWFATVKYMKANKAKSVEVASRVIRLDPAVVSRAYDNQMGMLSDDGVFDPKAIEVLKQSFVEMDILKARPEDAVLYTTKFVPAKP